MHDFCLTALMFLTGHVIKAGTHAYVETAHFPNWCIITTWKALTLSPCAFQVLMIHLIEECVIPAWAWDLAICL